jgi:hypothetical protein
MLRRGIRRKEAATLRVGAQAAVLICFLLLMVRGSPHTRLLAAFGALTGVTWITTACAVRALVNYVRSVGRGERALHARVLNPPLFFLGITLVFISFIANATLLAKLVTVGWPVFRASLDSGAWGKAQVFGLAFGLVLSLFGAYELWIGEFHLDYWSLFGGHAVIERNQILDAHMMVGSRADGDQYKPRQRIEITAIGLARPVSINVAVFRHQIINELIDWLGSSLERPSEL